MFESSDIINYLFKVYGTGKVPWTLSDSPWVPLSAGLGVGLARFGAGGSYQTSSKFGAKVAMCQRFYRSG